jgi:hypothetical protein
MNNTISVSLEAIGVRSSRRTWGAIALAAVVLMGLGAIITHFVERRDPVEHATGTAAPDDPFIIGTPVPEGEETPGVDFVSGTNDRLGTPGATPATPGPGSAASGGGSGTTGSTVASGTTGSTGTAGPRTNMSATGVSAGAGGNGGSGSGGSTGSTGSTGATGSTGTGTGATGAMGGDPAPDDTDDPEPAADPPAGGDAQPGERDIEMDMYAGRVRFLIRRYYAARAQTCFDRATRVNPSLSGSVSIGMTIGPDGAVSAARVARNTTGDDVLGTCLQNEVRQWRLSPPPGGESVQMNLPFSR